MLDRRGQGPADEIRGAFSRADAACFRAEITAAFNSTLEPDQLSANLDERRRKGPIWPISANSGCSERDWNRRLPSLCTVYLLRAQGLSQVATVEEFRVVMHCIPTAASAKITKHRSWRPALSWPPVAMQLKGFRSTVLRSSRWVLQRRRAFGYRARQLARTVGLPADLECPHDLHDPKGDEPATRDKGQHHDRVERQRQHHNTGGPRQCPASS